MALYLVSVITTQPWSAIGGLRSAKGLWLVAKKKVALVGMGDYKEDQVQFEARLFIKENWR